MKPKYKTWIKTKQMLIFIGLTLSLIVFEMFASGIFLKILLLAFILPLCYISLILLSSYICFSQKGGDYQALIHKRIVDEIGHLNTATILDIGAGSGSLSITAAQRFTSSAILAIDNWGDDWEYSKKQCEINAEIEKVQDRIDFIKASASKLPFEDNSFDVVISCLTFHEVKDTDNKLLVLHEALRVLKPKGKFVWFDLFKDTNIFKDLSATLYKDLGENVSVIKTYELWEMFSNCPRVLLHKKVLKDAVLVIGHKDY